MKILPKPQFFARKEGVFFLSYDGFIVVRNFATNDIWDCVMELRNYVYKSTGFEYAVTKAESNCVAVFTITQNTELEEQEYLITINENGIVLTAASVIGLRYAVATMGQILEQEGATLSYLEIWDFPQILNRGYYYDVTRGRIPTKEYMFKWIDLLAKYKYNQLQLYIEHSYLFSGLSEIWRDDTPLTSQDILEIDAYCYKKGIELVPSISTFGHFYKVLRTKTYRHLCEREDLCDREFGFVDRMEHHTLDISNEESFMFVKTLIDEYLPLFRSDKFNICGDETFDLGKGKSKKLVDEKGIDTVYTAYIGRLCDYLVRKGKTPMFWGDIICKFPEKIHLLPENTICLNWGYEADVTEESTKKLSSAGAHLYNCPGVAGWDQLVNKMHDSYLNISKMCKYAEKYGAEGILITDWGDCGHINHPDMAIPGMIYGAASSWNLDFLPENEINRAISILEYHDRDGVLMDLLADISTYWCFKWRDLVNVRENRSIDWQSITVTNLNESQKKLNEKKKELLSYLHHLELETRDHIRPYLIAIDGMILLQRIAMYSLTKFNFEVEENYRLACDIEKWFLSYKNEWWKVSLESELYRIQDVFFWAADCIRAGKNFV